MSAQQSTLMNGAQVILAIGVTVERTEMASLLVVQVIGLPKMPEFLHQVCQQANRFLMDRRQIRPTGTRGVVGRRLLETGVQDAEDYL